jgi:hypothetical protein
MPNSLVYTSTITPASVPAVEIAKAITIAVYRFIGKSVQPMMRRGCASTVALPKLPILTDWIH